MIAPRAYPLILLFLLAAADAMGTRGPASVELHNVRTGQRQTLDAEQHDAIAEPLREVLRLLLKGLREGHFPQYAPSCRTCGCTAVCGTGVAALCDRKASDPRAQAMDKARELTR